MNEIGAVLIVLSAAVLLFGLINALLGLSLRTERNLVRVLALELWDQPGLPIGPRAGRRGRHRLAARFARFLLGTWRPGKRLTLRLLGYPSQALANDLARQAFYVNCAVVALAFSVLSALMVVTDLSNVYVTKHSSVALPIFFRITGAWAGSEGSLLFWYFLLTFFSAVVVYQTRDRLHNRLPALYLSLFLLNLLFVMLALFFKDAQPFRAYNAPMEAGRGLNPLLLHWAMIIHPPMLYVGYVSFAIPFSIAAAALVSGNLREDWLQLIRRWSIFSWFFLGTGILLGSKWAYEELGWGGYWAWDPVENASLMPFLLATAFLHSLLVQERRGMLRFWNILLVILAYHFCLLGTWITRSGVLEGPHTFAQSTIGTPFIIYIGASALFYLRYLFFMRARLQPERSLEAVTSKEGSLLLNNFLMTLAVLVILIGVFSPLLPLDCGFHSGVFGCNKVEWKQSTYNKLMVPVGILTLFLMGASPLLTWRKSADHVYARNLRIPLLAGLVGTVAFALSYGLFFTRPGSDYESAWGSGRVAEIFSILTVGIAVFVVFGLGQEFVRAVRSRRARFDENVLLAFTRTVLRNKRRYGGYLVHLSIVFLFLGYAGEAFKKTARFQFQYQLAPLHAGSPVVHYRGQDKAYLENYEIQAGDLFLRPHVEGGGDPDKPVHFAIAQEAHFHVEQGSKRDRKPTVVGPRESPFALANRPIALHARLARMTAGIVLDGRMKTERHFHPQVDPARADVLRDARGVAQRTPTSKPDIRSTWSEDIYIQLGSLSDAATGQNPDLNHRYEWYYFQMRGNPEAYAQLFPQKIVATLEVWVNPLVKFIWLGSILFFLSGLVILLPFGERDL